MKYLILIFLLWNAAYCQPNHADQLKDMMIDFAKTYPSLNVPNLQLSYQDNLRSISSPAQRKKQQVFYAYLKNRLSNVDPANLTAAQRIDHQILLFEIALNRERLKLENEWAKRSPDIDDKGIYHQKNGKAWYAYLVKKWIGAQVTPEELKTFGQKEVAKVQAKIAEIKTKAGKEDFYAYLNGESFEIIDAEQVQAVFEQRKQQVNTKLEEIFPVRGIPDLQIARGQNERLAQTPGYYSANTFYYNLFDTPFNRRKIDWLFIHEANPGHHFQINYEQGLNLPDYRTHVRYSGFAEGWGAYVEDIEIGKKVGLYADIYDELGKWEWDLVRSARIVLDVGINYEGWTWEKALAYWKENVPNQESIAMREINRMRRWPAQVHSYKWGEGVILSLRAQQQEKLGDAFDLKAFHETILSQGAVPVEVLPYLFEEGV